MTEHLSAVCADTKVLKETVKRVEEKFDDKAGRMESKLDKISTAVVGNGKEDRSLLSRMQAVEQNASTHKRWFERWWHVIVIIVAIVVTWALSKV